MRKFLAAVGILLASLVPVSQAAAANPVHTKLVDVSGEYTIPAGQLCTFPLHDSYVADNNILEFYAPDGSLRLQRIVINMWGAHQNVTTGFTLTEEAHYVVEIDPVAGTTTIKGNGWHVADADGKILLLSGGKYVVDMATGEILEATPNSHPVYAEICALLGDAPAQ